ncbi:GerMN domain-containing protein [Amycolatopsis suaedae]|uniref:GerMN domain-containing protein n=1 Tax=Amycolatopsis suaedae TaxID=2510978 RepID=A0A4Q7J7Z9_9PSEU|nr:GerMN domain-containing protein [Amycolatopsis suaedae]RZQ62493.1 hypothetical protein EWH70_19785 [Amycolatopsis suaedae]
MKRLTVLLAVLLAVAACGVRPSAVIPGGDAPGGSVVTTLIFFVSGDELAPAPRPDGSTDTLAQLAAGPTADERAQGLRTELPPGISIGRDYSNADLVVTVSVAPHTLSGLAVQQIACTVTNIRGALGAPSVSGPVTVVGPGESLGPRYCGVS